MTDLFVGGEDLSFTMTGGFGFGTLGTGDSYRTAFARGVVGAAAISISTADPPAARATTPVFAATSSIWIHGQYSTQSTAGTTLNATLLRALDGTGVARIVVRGTATSGQLKIDKRNSAGTFTNLVTSAAGALPAKATPTSIDLWINYAVSGQCQLWIDGVNVADTGAGVDVTTDSATTLAQADFSQTTSANTGHNTGWSEVLIRDSTTLGAAVFTIPPVAAGNTQSWTPNTVANINEVLTSDATLVATSSNNSLSEWTVSTTLPTGTWTISSVQQEARVSRGATGPQHFEWLVRTVDGTDHVTGSVAPITSFQNFANNWATNPQTSAAWAVGDLINAGIESLA